MIVIEITDGMQLENVIAYLSNLTTRYDNGYVTSLSVGLDELDNGAKFKECNGAWSPPFVGKMSGEDDRVKQIRRLLAGQRGRGSEETLQAIQAVVWPGGYCHDCASEY